MAGVAFVLIVLIICLSVLFGYHMYLCNENSIKMYADPKYDERISRLEKILGIDGENNKNKKTSELF